MPLAPSIEWSGPLEWVNRHENVRQRVARLVDLRNAVTASRRSTVEAYNAMTAAIRGLLRRAIDAGVRVRAIGGGWSLSEVAVTDGWLFNTQPLGDYLAARPEPVSTHFLIRCSNIDYILNIELSCVFASLMYQYLYVYTRARECKKW